MKKRSTQMKDFSMIKLRHEGQGDMFYATRESAGFDVCANEDTHIPAGEWRLVATGLYISESFAVGKLTLSENLTLPVLPELQIRPRSGLAMKHGISIVNSPSTIDADYRGEIKVPLINHGKVDFKILKGDRIAQGICAMVFQAPGIAVIDKERGQGGFGSTGH
jgi:dUTP pyrophosphatase